MYEQLCIRVKIRIEHCFFYNYFSAHIVDMVKVVVYLYGVCWSSDLTNEGGTKTVTNIMHRHDCSYKYIADSRLVDKETFQPVIFW